MKQQKLYLEHETDKLNLGYLPAPGKLLEIERKSEEFTYLGSTVTKDGGAEADIRKRLSKARNPFNIFLEKCDNLNHTVKRRSFAYSKAVY